MGGPVWRSEEKILAEAMRRQGISPAKIGAALGRSERSVGHMLVTLALAYTCTRCGATKPARDYRVLQQRDGGVCRACQPPTKHSPNHHSRRGRRVVGGGDGRATGTPGLLPGGGDGQVTGRRLLPPLKAVADVRDHEARIAQLRTAIRNEGSGRGHRRLDVSGYVFPDERAWIARFGEQPEVMGKIIRDIAQEAKAADPAVATPIGRRSHSWITSQDLVHYLPTVARSLGLMGDE